MDECFRPKENHPLYIQGKTVLLSDDIAKQSEKEKISLFCQLWSNLQLLEISRGQLISFDLQVFQKKLIGSKIGKKKKKKN